MLRVVGVEILLSIGIDIRHLARDGVGILVDLGSSGRGRGWRRRTGSAPPIVLWWLE